MFTNVTMRPLTLCEKFGNRSLQSFHTQNDTNERTGLVSAELRPRAGVRKLSHYFRLRASTLMRFHVSFTVGRAGGGGALGAALVRSTEIAAPCLWNARRGRGARGRKEREVRGLTDARTDKRH
ncbi:hypothetical protein EVAR_44894_1 [Eumeta japonica]|uniref:Uncharacterized protein n=1 Tax=Eumeta variegata TaxID=151549 RepID=A0A4C1XKW8_EUMVA|nr:hypothetical protein EVAR_44894_1 [Eumeta japonica]